jgi:NTP pyrophosphatase (non-canonical NTP hydrolase)
MSNQLAYQLTRCLLLSAKEPKGPLAATLHLACEVGELAEAVLVETGNITHKTLKEPSTGEIADVINSALCVLAKLMPHKTIDEQLAALTHYLTITHAKWEQILTSKEVS